MGDSWEGRLVGEARSVRMGACRYDPSCGDNFHCLTVSAQALWQSRRSAPGEDEVLQPMSSEGALRSQAVIIRHFVYKLLCVLLCVCVHVYTCVHVCPYVFTL